MSGGIKIYKIYRGSPNEKTKILGGQMSRGKFFYKNYWGSSKIWWVGGGELCPWLATIKFLLQLRT